MVSFHLRALHKSCSELQTALPLAQTQPGGRQMPLLPHTPSLLISTTAIGLTRPGQAVGIGQREELGGWPVLPQGQCLPSASNPVGHPGTWGFSAADGVTKVERGGRTSLKVPPSIGAGCEPLWFQARRVIRSFTCSLIRSSHCPPHRSCSTLPLLGPHLESFLIPFSYYLPSPCNPFANPVRSTFKIHLKFYLLTTSTATRLVQA